MVLYSLDWTNTGFSFIILTINLFRHPTLIEQGLFYYQVEPKCLFLFCVGYYFQTAAVNYGRNFKD